MRHPTRIGLGFAAALALSACTGGGGQLAQGQSQARAGATTTVPTVVTTTPPTTGDATATTAPSTSVSTAGSTEPIPTAQLGGPKSATSAAKTLARVERGLRGTNREPAHLAKLGRAQQLAYRAIAAHPEWVDTVLAGIPEDLRAPVQSTIDAGTALNRLTDSTAAPTEFPDWTILTPEPAETLRAYYAEAEQTYGIPWQYLAAIHFSETRMGRIHGNSTAGAQGPMQFIPDTWAAYGGGGDINSNHDAILAAGRYLEANNAATDIDSALFRYNNDERYVAAIKAYASVMMADPGAYDGYYQWQVFFAKADGTVLLPEGWSAR